MTAVAHLVSRASQNGGVGIYARLLRRAMLQYHDDLQFEEVIPENDGKLQHQRPPHLILAELGVHDRDVFSALRRRENQSVPRLICIHDPPVIVSDFCRWTAACQGNRGLRGIRRLINRFIEAASLRRAICRSDVIICLNKRGKSVMVEKLKRILGFSCPVNYISHLNYADPSPVLRERKPSDGSITAGLFGYVVPRKGHHVVLGALEQHFRKTPLSPLRMVIAGGTSLGESDLYFRRIVKQTDSIALKGRAEMLGPLKEDEVGDFFQRLDLACCPYTDSRFFSASGPVAWARTYGLPVLASDTAQFRGLVEHEKDGFLIRAGDITAWSDAFDRIIKMPALREAFPTASRVGVEGSWKVVTKQYRQSMDGLTSLGKNADLYDAKEPKLQNRGKRGLWIRES